MHRERPKGIPSYEDAKIVNSRLLTKRKAKVNIIDIIIICCCIPALVHGISKGFVSQAFSLVALILGVWLSFKFSGAMSDWLLSVTEISGTLVHVISFALILLIVMLAATLAGKIVEKILKVVMLGWLNKLLGVVFALLKAALIIGLIVILIDTVNSNIPLIPAKTIDESVLFHPVKDFADFVFPYLKELVFKK